MRQRALVKRLNLQCPAPFLPIDLSSSSSSSDISLSESATNITTTTNSSSSSFRKSSFVTTRTEMRRSLFSSFGGEEGKLVSDSAIETTQLVLPSHANTTNITFGGQVFFCFFFVFFFCFFFVFFFVF